MHITPICCACFEPIQGKPFQFRENGRRFHNGCAQNTLERLERSKAKTGKEEKKSCPRCGEPMEDFAVAWGWQCCYQCSVKLREEEGKNETARNTWT